MSHGWKATTLEQVLSSYDDEDEERINSSRKNLNRHISQTNRGLTNYM